MIYYVSVRRMKRSCDLSSDLSSDLPPLKGHRQLLTIVDPSTGQRGPVTEVRDYAESMRLQQGGELQ